MISEPYFAIFDPISWLVIHWGVSRLAATGIIAAGAATVAGAIYLTRLTYSRLMDEVRKARLRNRSNDLVKFIKSQVNSNYRIDVIDLDSNGNETGKKTIFANELDSQTKQMANVEIFNC
jgi:hypothetical protein